MAEFSEQHYKAIAKAVRDSTFLDTEVGKRGMINKSILVDALITLFEADNENFDVHRFVDACFVDESHGSKR